MNINTRIPRKWMYDALKELETYGLRFQGPQITDTTGDAWDARFVSYRAVSLQALLEVAKILGTNDILVYSNFQVSYEPPKTGPHFTTSTSIVAGVWRMDLLERGFFPAQASCDYIQAYGSDWEARLYGPGGLFTDCRQDCPGEAGSIRSGCYCNAEAASEHKGGV